MNQLLRTSLLTIGALFPIVNPLGNAPIFLSLTRGFTSQDRQVLARKIALNGFVLLVVSILVGTHILRFFGISLPVVQVGGGIVVIANGWSLLGADDEDADADAARPSLRRVDLSQKAFYPLTLPLTVGPGSISVAIAVGANWAGLKLTNWPAAASAIIGPAAIAVAIYLSYRFAGAIARLLGATAMNALIRLSSFILLCIGVQIFWNGFSVLLRAALMP
jgi:multiple antibiotic resistance protein